MESTPASNRRYGTAGPWSTIPAGDFPFCSAAKARAGSGGRCWPIRGPSRADDGYAAPSWSMQARCGHAFAFDEEAGVAVLFGGIDRCGKCSPMVWSDDLHGLVMHGGEARHGGPQFDTTWVLECLGSQTD